MQASQRIINDKNLSLNPILRFFVSPEGRIGRLDFFLGFLAFIFTASCIKYVIGEPTLFTIIPLISFIIICIKRLHDLNMSGFWVILGIIPIINMILAVQLFFFRGYIGPNLYGYFEGEEQAPLDEEVTAS